MGWPCLWWLESSTEGTGGDKKGAGCCLTGTLCKSQGLPGALSSSRPHLERASGIAAPDQRGSVRWRERIIKGEHGSVVSPPPFAFLHCVFDYLLRLACGIAAYAVAFPHRSERHGAPARDQCLESKPAQFPSESVEPFNNGCNARPTRAYNA